MNRFRIRIKAMVDAVGLWYLRLLNRREWKQQHFTGFNERAVEYSFLFRQMAAHCPRRILDVGTGQTALPSLMRTFGAVVDATDNIRDYWSFGMTNRHYHVMNDDITSTNLTGPYDLVSCISVLEHVEKFDRAIAAMFSLLAPGGHLLLTCPYNEISPCANVYDLPESAVREHLPFKARAFCRQDIERWFSVSPAIIIEEEFWRFYGGKYWTCGERIVPPVRTSAAEPHQMACFLIRRM